MPTPSPTRRGRTAAPAAAAVLSLALPPRVLDGRNGRISWFNLDTGFVRSHPYHPLSLTWKWEGVLDDDGILWATHFIRAEEPGERGRGVKGSEQYLLDSRLRVWTTIDGDPAYRLERRTPDGDVTLVIEAERLLLPLEPHHRASADSIAATFEERWDTKFDRSRIPDVAPSILSFFLDDDARLWVLASTPDSDSLRTLDTYDAEDGQWLGTMTTGLTIMPNPRPVVRGDRMGVVVHDELDVPYVVRGRVVGVEQ